MAQPELKYQFTSPASRAAAAPGRHRPPEPGPAVRGRHRTRWMLSGACCREDPELFFPSTGSAAAQPQVSAAKAVCAGCPVRPECLSYAKIARVDGIWGGTTREERRPDAASDAQS